MLAHSTPRFTVATAGQGGPAICVDGAPSPAFFCGNNQFGRDEVLLEETAMAGRAGVPFFAFELPLWACEDDAEAEAWVAKFREGPSRGYFLLRMWLHPSREWLLAHPDEQMRRADGTIHAFVSPASEAWRRDTAERLRARVSALLAGPHGDHFVGIAPLYMNTAEWFYPETNHFYDYSPPSLKAFRVWLAGKYGSDQALQKAWGQPDATLPTAAFPTPEEREATAWGNFRDPVEHRPAADMQAFLSDTVADTIAFYAKVIKEASGGKLLVASFYGYTLELNNNGPRALAHSGHLAFSRILNCDDVDLVLAPYSYFQRGLGQPGHFHLPVDSVALHGKLAVMEEDSYTHLAQPPSEGMMAPGWRERTTSLEETLALCQRNTANFLTHGAGFWYFDLLSDGRWASEAFWEAQALTLTLATEARAAGPFRPEVAFLVDEAAVHALGATTHPQLVQSLSLWRAELDQIGTPVGYYLQSEVELLPDSVKVAIFANAWQVSPSLKEWTDRLVERGGSVFWNYAAGALDVSTPTAAAVSERTGFPVRACFDEVPMDFRVENSGAVYDAGRTPWSPRLVIGPPADGESHGYRLLARYAASGEGAVASRSVGPGQVFYSTAARVPVSILRMACEESGVHLYRDTAGMAGVIGDYLIVHTSLEGPAKQEIRLCWPRPWHSVERLVPEATVRWSGNGDRHWKDQLPGGVTAVYRVYGEPNCNNE